MDKDRQQSFQEAFEKHSDEMFRHCFLRLSDRERAVELTQETFLRAWKYTAEGKEIENHRSFFYRILNNLIVDEYRKHRTQSLDALLDNEENATALEGEYLRDESDALEDSIVRFDAMRALAALKELPEPYRGVLLLRYVDGLSPKEIAKETHESENTISVRIHRGLQKMRGLLEPKQS